MCFRSIRPEDIFRYRGSGKCILVDVREQEEYLRGHIPGAVNVPYEELQDRIQEMRELTRFGTTSEVPVIFYCERGNTSLLAARDLYKAGFSVINVHGGLVNYKGPLVRCSS